MSIFDFRIGTKLAISVAIPLIALVALAGFDLSLKWNTRSEMAGLGELADGVAGISRLVHELQRERGLSAVFISSKGAQMRSELAAQRGMTDQQRQRAAAFVAQLRTIAPTSEFKDVAAQAEASIAAMDRRRNEIDALSMTTADSIAYLTETIANLLAVGGEIAKVGSRGDVTTAISAYVNFMQGKERAGQERATVAAGIAAGKFDMAAYSRALGLVAAQATFFRVFDASATSHQRDVFKRTLSAPASETVSKMREIVTAGGLSGDMKGLEAATWFEAATARIDLFKAVEDQIAGDLKALTTAIEGEATHAFTVLAAIIVFCLMLCLLASAIMTRSITRPLAAFGSALHELSIGNFTVALPGLSRRDEIGTMARAVEAFKDKAQEKARLEAEAQQASERERAAERKKVEEREAAERAAATEREEASRKDAMHKLADSFETAVGSIIKQVSAASTELEAAAITLSKTAETTQHQSTIVASASEQASANVQSVASATEEMTSSIREISRQVRESSKIANEAVQQAGETNARIDELSKAAARIGDVVKLITSVAEQTNLLALNATIEAARAGEAGRGFAVVAHEVKALAAQTAKATDEISAQVSGMQTATQQSVVAIERIGGTIGRISEISSTIAAAVEQQGAATQEIARNVGEAAKGTSMVTSNIADVSRGASETGSASSQVLSSAQSLSNESNRLKAEVDKFFDTIRTGPANRRKGEDPGLRGPDGNAPRTVAIVRAS
jgi:methyl-accepting chemotaxis protein